MRRAAASALARRRGGIVGAVRRFARERDADERPRHRQFGDRRPAGEKAHERHRDPCAVRRDVEAGRGPDGIAHGELAQREDRCGPQRELHIAVDAQAIAGADRLILRVIREEPGGHAKNRRDHHHRQQSCESEGRNLQWLHVKSSRTGLGPRTPKPVRNKQRRGAAVAEPQCRSLYWCPNRHVVISELCD